MIIPNEVREAVVNSGAKEVATNARAKKAATNTRVRKATTKTKSRKPVAKTAADIEAIGRNTLARMASSKLNEESVAVGFYYGTVVDEQDLFYKGEHIKILPVILLKKGTDERIATRYAVAFKVNSIELNSAIEMKVPKGKIGMFAGRNGWLTKKWCEQLGLKNISLVEEA